MPTIYIGRWLSGFHTSVQGMLSLMDSTQEAQHRLKVITFWKKYGEEATKDAFNVSRSALYEWQKILRDNKGKLSSLNSKSRCPHNARRMTTPAYKIQAVCSLRTAFPYLGPKKIVAILKTDHGISIGHATVGKIIDRYNLPCSPKIHVAKRKKKKKNRLPKGFEAKLPGDLVAMDTVVIQEHNQKKYIITAVDIATRIAIAWTYKRHSSKQARDMLLRMQILLGVPIQKVITDNGSEFCANYEQCCNDLKIVHCWTYPKSPKMNPFCERFNRTIQEEAQFPEFTASIEEWNAWIAHYIQQYNLYRPHVSLEYKRPFDVYISLLNKNEQESEMYAGHTLYCTNNHPPLHY